VTRSRTGLTGRTAVVTGVSRRAGIGFAIAGRLLDEGASVFCQAWTAHDEAQPWGRDPDGVGALERELRSRGRAAIVERDLGQPGAPEELVESAMDLFGPIDILVATTPAAPSNGSTSSPRRSSTPPGGSTPGPR
jgi:3-oxoacyl-[acyl-carrier protein] reductase